MTQPTLHFTIDPAHNGNADAALVVLGASLGTTTDVWASVVPALTPTHRVLRYDLPGHGFSPPTHDAFTLEEIADAVVELADADTFHYIGTSFGGAVGLALAVRHPERLASLAVLCSGAKIGTSAAWNDRAAAVRAHGTASLVGGSAIRWFAPDFMNHNPAAGTRALDQLAHVDDESYALACHALAVFDQTDAAAAIRTPVLCLSGEFDTVVTSLQMHELAASIPGARALIVAGAAHQPTIEQPTEVGALLGEWLAGAAHGYAARRRA